VIDPETEAKIQRLFENENWPKGTIASQLELHHSVVTRVLEQAGVPQPSAPRPSKLDPFLPFIIATLQRYPSLHASRLHAMCCERGYIGGQSHFRDVVRRHRPRPPAEAYLRLRTLPGEQAQVDWAHFGKINIGCALRMLVAFVIVLAYSRRIFLRFFLGMQTENFLRGHDAAFRAWGGCPRVALYDNLKSCVLERSGDAIRFHPLMVAFAAHHRFERAIRYVRGAFFAGRQYRDLDDLNQQAQLWCDGPAMDRPWPEDRSLTVRDAFAKEKDLLLSLPGDGFALDERREVSVGKTPYVRFDLNDYSIPHDHVRKTLVVVASLETVRVLDRQTVIASHRRSYGKGEQIEDPAHIERLVQDKRLARNRGFDRLHHAAPSTETMLVALAERGENLGAATRQLLILLERFGADQLETAVKCAIDKGAPHPHAVRHILEQERRRAGQAPRVAPALPDDPRIRDLVVKTHSLSSYDAISTCPGDAAMPQQPAPPSTNTEVRDGQA
jgi:transposase